MTAARSASSTCGAVHPRRMRAVPVPLVCRLPAGHEGWHSCYGPGENGAVTSIWTDAKPHPGASSVTHRPAAKPFVT